MAYERVNWENLPSTKTPVNADNLNKMDKVIANAVEKSDLLNLIYPVGSIYMSVNSTSPATLFGGTWQQIEDRFLLACGSTYNAGATGGEAKHKLTVDEMPSHTHTITWAQYSKKYSDATNGANNGQEFVGGSTDSGHQLAAFWCYNGNERSGKIQTVGSSNSHNNMPPYLAVYIWKRIA